MSGFWDGRRVIVTGGGGFLGGHVVARLESAGATEIFVSRSADYDLRTKNGVDRAVADGRPDIVFHVAVVGGIGAKRENPGRFNAIYLVPVNLYGAGDNFDPKSSEVVPAFIKKCVDARESGASQIDVWGTGSAPRESLYVDDTADGIVLATKRYDGAEPVNLGLGQEITIHEQVTLIAELSSYRGDIRWDPSKPDGQPRRALDTSRACNLIDFQAHTAFEVCLNQTLTWYKRWQGIQMTHAAGAGLFVTGASR